MYSIQSSSTHTNLESEFDKHDMVVFITPSYAYAITITTKPNPFRIDLVLYRYLYVQFTALAYFVDVRYIHIGYT